ncbi:MULTISPECIES: hypothetical protein [Propionispora]|uniref:Spo0E like sporulation regulatory protein n=2 Tax=Propionispora TaxID=112902 RepID=A0A1H8WRM8_9FIRM|nr:MULTISPECIES: hypothetical protein [Propionispora]SEP30384.1 hypothetical protein SAMN04490178_11770 [Propionispora vibrioides]SHJ27826.1 hypothetical protein SAMN02745170_02147 [Propionispora hippei DSM 15287]
MSQELWKEVEQLQEKLHDTISKKGVGSPEAIRVMQAFREKMDEYKRCTKKPLEP